MLEWILIIAVITAIFYASELPKLKAFLIEIFTKVKNSEKLKKLEDLTNKKSDKNKKNS